MPEKVGNSYKKNLPHKAEKRPANMIYVVEDIFMLMC